MRPERPALSMLDEHEDGESAEVKVVLAWGDLPFDGEAVGSSEPAARPRLVGEATLRALEKMSEGRLQLDLSAVATTDLGTSRVSIAQIRIEGTGETLVGSAVLREDDPSKATARAVLDAVNRHLGKLFG